MSEATQTPAWMKDELVKEIPKEKLELLQQIFEDFQSTSGKSGTPKDQKGMFLILMPVLKKAKEMHLSFTPTEMKAAIAAIQKYSTPEESEKIDKIFQTMSNQAKSTPL